MENAKQLADRFREVMLSGKWIAFTNFKEQVDDLTWEEATQKIRSLNTIAALTFHLDYYINGVLQVLNGGELTIRDKYSWDMPAIAAAADWDELRARALNNAELFAQAAEKLTDDQLESVFVKQAYGNYRRSIEGMIEHCYYHFGQVVLIKKMIREENS